MDTNELLKYEMPSVAEFISIGWMQTILAWFVANRVNRKLKRYKARKEREVFIARFQKKPSNPN